MRTERRAPFGPHRAALLGTLRPPAVRHRADQEHELAPGILEPLGMDRVPADVLHQVVHAFLVIGPLEEPAQARAHARGDRGRDGDPLGAARHLGAVDANVNAPAPLFADERNVPPDRLELPIGGGDADAQEPGNVGARQLPAREQRADQLRGPLDGSEPPELRTRHDPQRILRSAADLKSWIRSDWRCGGLAAGTTFPSRTRKQPRGGCRVRYRKDVGHADPQVLAPSRPHRLPLDRHGGVHALGAGHGGPTAMLDRPDCAANSRARASGTDGAREQRIGSALRSASVPAQTSTTGRFAIERSTASRGYSKSSSFPARYWSYAARSKWPWPAKLKRMTRVFPSPT